MIAILIPVYKPEDTFEFFLKQLSSAIIERKADIKLVIVNDGNSPELLCFKNIPKILETPYIEGNPPYKFEIAMIKNKVFNAIVNNLIY